MESRAYLSRGEMCSGLMWKEDKMETNHRLMRTAALLKILSAPQLSLSVRRSEGGCLDAI